MAPFNYKIPDRSFVDGQWTAGSGTEKLKISSAYDDSVVLPELLCANTADIDAAVDSAERALAVWKATPVTTKRQLFLKYADLITEHAEELASLEALVAAKPVHFAKYEAYHAAEWFRFYAGYIDKLGGESFPIDEEGYYRFIRHEPYGLCGAINPFNAPIPGFAMKAAPALAAGNVIVSKCSEFNPFSSLRIAELAIEAGFPAGVLNILVGTIEAGSALSHHMKIRKISFTGSVEVGKQVQLAATQSNLKRVSLELGGKSPFIIFDDADIEKAIIDSTQNILTLNGQGCILGTRVFVHEAVVDKYLQGVKAGLEQYASTLGKSPFDSSTISSPLAHAGQLKRVLEFLAKGKEEAELITGGGRFGSTGCYIEPTIFYKPKPGAEIVTKEIFGPVLCVDSFTDEQTVIARANDTEFGLGAYIYTSSIDCAFRVSAQLDAGTVCINNTSVMHQNLPYGGYKSSGIGRENGTSVLKAYTQEKAVILKYNEKP